jgi:hypothetical protein
MKITVRYLELDDELEDDEGREVEVKEFIGRDETEVLTDAREYCDSLCKKLPDNHTPMAELVRFECNEFDNLDLYPRLFERLQDVINL